MFSFEKNIQIISQIVKCLDFWSELRVTIFVIDEIFAY